MSGDSDINEDIHRCRIKELPRGLALKNDLRKDRQAQGVDLAMRKGIKFGRKHSLNNEQINAMRQKRSEGIKIADLVDEFKVSKASVYRCLSSVSCQQA